MQQAMVFIVGSYLPCISDWRAEIVCYF